MYRTIDAAFWTDPKVRGYDVSTKLFALYLVTNPHSHLGGIYYLPDVLICDELGIKPTELDTLWNTLSETGFARKDNETSVVWVIRMFFYQGRGEKNNRAVANHLESLHNSFLIKDFVKTYECVRPYLSHRVSDRVSDTHSHFGTPNRNRTGEGTEQDQIGDGLPYSETFANSREDLPKGRDASRNEDNSIFKKQKRLELPEKVNSERNQKQLFDWLMVRLNQTTNGEQRKPIPLASWEAILMSRANWDEPRWFRALLKSTEAASKHLIDPPPERIDPDDPNNWPEGQTCRARVLTAEEIKNFTWGDGK